MLKIRCLLGKEPGSSHLQTDTAANRLSFSIPVDELEVQLLVFVNSLLTMALLGLQRKDRELFKLSLLDFVAFSKHLECLMS